MKDCAFLTLDDRGDFVIDDDLAIAPLAARGWRVHTVSWRQDTVPWNDFDAVVIRSTWDYWDDPPAFLEVLERIDGETRLANPLHLVRWNIAKTYLQELERVGVAVVPTLWPQALTPEVLERAFDTLESGELVVKPVVGANGDDAFRLGRPAPPDRLQQLTQCFRGRPAMVQPFLPHVLSEGEYSLMFFNGRFSHAILKHPAAGEFRSQEERGASVRLVTPEASLLRAAGDAMAALPETPLYARVDMVRSHAEQFVLMELELIEPAIYLRCDRAAPERFARAVDDWFAL